MGYLPKFILIEMIKKIPAAKNLMTDVVGLFYSVSWAEVGCTAIEF